MKATTAAFLDLLNQSGIKYEFKERPGKSDWVNVRYSGDSIRSISIQLFFSDDCEDVAIRSFSICKVPANKKADMLNLLNALMDEYRWLRFYLDEDNEVTAAIDAVITVATAAPIAKELMLRTLNIVDDVYPRIMKALWS